MPSNRLNHQEIQPTLILLLSVNLAEIRSQGKLFFWPRPQQCPRCGSCRMWGHGFVSRYFDEVPVFVLLKRWRCPDCHAVHTCRPVAYWRRFSASIETILSCLSTKQAGGNWSINVSRQRQQYWAQGFRIQSLFTGFPACSLATLIKNNIIIATHSVMHRAENHYPHLAYLRLAVTKPP